MAGVIQQMGAPVVATGLLGGSAGAWMAQLMEAESLPHDIIGIEHETRGRVMILDEQDGLRVEIPGPAPRVSEDEIARLNAKVGSLAGKGDWVVLAGDVPTGAPMDMYETLARVAHQAGAKVALDLRGESLMAALKEIPEIWKPNAEEMEEAIGLGLDPVEQCERGTAIVMSEGRYGAVLLRADAPPRRFSPPARRAWNPAGSGNALLATTVAALHGKADWDTALRAGLAAGVANLRHDTPGFATYAEVKELQPLVSVGDEPDEDEASDAAASRH
jgi:1-phosphofructokinase family hexose kinase